ncbi:MAG: hypothetical protein Q9180_002920 [Flavoplaca navasiana]
MSTSTRRLVGHKARDAFIEKNMDPKLYKRQKEVAKEFIREMKQRGYSLQTGDFRQALRDAGIRSRWIGEQIEKAKLELELKEEAIRMDEAEALDYAKSITAMEEEIAAWEVKQEDALDEDAESIKELIKERPRLAAKVLKDRTVEQMVEKGLQEFKKDLAFYEQRIDELEGIFQRAAMAKVDSMKLPDKLHQRAAKFDDLIAVTIAERDKLHENLTEAHRQLNEAKQEAVSKETEHADAIQARKSQVKMVVGQNVKLKGDLTSCVNQKGSLDREVQNLRQQVQDLEVTQSHLLEAARQASDDMLKLGEEKEDLKKKVAALDTLIESERPVAAHQRSQANTPTLIAVQDDLTNARVEHATAFKAVQDELFFSRKSLSQLKAENINIKEESLHQQRRIEELQRKLQSCQDNLQASNQTLRRQADVFSEEKAKLDANWQARYNALEELNHQLQRAAMGTSAHRGEDVANTRYDTSLQTGPSEVKRLADRYFHLELLRTATSNMVPLETVESLIELQNRFLSQHGGLIGNDSSFDRCMPRMIFEAEGARAAPFVHAINFNIAMRDGKVSLQDGQAIFNSATIIVDDLVYPFILDALETALPIVEHLSWPVNSIGFRGILMIIQGVAFLNYLVQAMQISPTDVQLLCTRLEAYLTQKCQGSVLETVFKQAMVSVSGQPIMTWLIDSRHSDARLDDTNSAIGADRCIVGDTASLKNFVLLDKTEGDEVLYAFGMDEIKALELDRTDLRLVLNEGALSTQVAGQVVLSRHPGLDDHVDSWCELFNLADKLSSA